MRCGLRAVNDFYLTTGQRTKRTYIRPVASRCGATIFALGLIASAALATRTPSPVGAWSTANGHGVIEIARCGDALCGRIVGVERRPGDPIPTDVYGRSQCGLTIITNEKLDTDGTWLGEVTDPRDGGTYRAKLWLDEAGDLNLRGFIGIPQLGATQTWHRFNGHLTSDCRAL
ncbi:MAG: DUF2147 domain-containing protein [Acetobacteraceae bacterium]|jgi:uncharacterized protein (DUF2147 family)